MAFGSGSSVIMPLKNEAGMPLNGLEVAQNVAEVLAYDPTVRYIGMAVYCIDEQCLYRFKRTLLDDGTYSDGLQDSDFQPEEGNVNVNLVTNDYSTLPTVTKDTIIYCKNDYIDTNVTPNVNYEKGFYLYDTNTSAWELIDINAKDKYPLWETSVEYSEEELVTYNKTKYRCIVSHTSGATFEENKDNWIYVLEEYYVLTQVQYDNLVTNGVITDDTKHLYVVIDAKDEETVDIIYEDYSQFPVDLTKEVIVYAKNDYVDDTTLDEYSKGFYLYNLDTQTWDLIGSGEIEASKEIEDSIITEITSINDTVYSINAEKTTQTVGAETIEVIKSLEDITLDDGTEIYVGDVIEIHKYIDSVEVYTYSIIEDEFYNPFI